MTTIEVKNIDGNTVLPVPGSTLAAGYDIVAVGEPTIVGTQLPPSFNEPDWWKSVDYIEYHTQLFISPQPARRENTREVLEEYHTLLHPRSSVRKYNLVLANSIGLVDSDYRGEIIMCFKYIWQPEDFMWGNVVDSAKSGSEPIPMMLGRVNVNKIYKAGDKVGQLVVEPTTPAQFTLVSELDKTDRGEGGFGSTDKPEVKRPLGSPVTYTEGVFGIQEAYQKAGGVPIKKRYLDEIKDRERQAQMAVKSQPSKPVLPTGIRERKA